MVKMFQDNSNSRDCVQPISFQTLHEDNQDPIDHAPSDPFKGIDSNDDRRPNKSTRVLDRSEINESNTTDGQSPKLATTKTIRNRHSRSRAIEIGPNFSLEYSYPAVILENVCFSVDKSQQQANFLRECLVRLDSCCSSIRSNKNGLPHQNKVQILKSVNLTVPHGSIFGLLGPSSCGKTTLLRCLVGLLKPSSGSIRLFGNTTTTTSSSSNGANSRGGSAAGTTTSYGSKISCFSSCHKLRHASHRSNRDCKVPGPNVGYMPQDLGLYEDFTIEQLLTIFGRYMRMDTQLIKSRIAFMAKFLELPEVDRQIQTLSGGQKRRVSFAIACLHMPPLIILDEPTVGVDPLLRRSIWKYLRRMASEENKTIIITTHYIEEAAQADQVALMRAGEILIQNTPAKIMESNQSKTLEEAFLKICNNVDQSDGAAATAAVKTVQKNQGALKLFPQPQFNWNDFEPKGVQVPLATNGKIIISRKNLTATNDSVWASDGGQMDKETLMNELKLRAEEKLALYDKLRSSQHSSAHQTGLICPPEQNDTKVRSKITSDTNLSMIPSAGMLLDSLALQKQPGENRSHLDDCAHFVDGGMTSAKAKKLRLLKRGKLTINNTGSEKDSHQQHDVFDHNSDNRLANKHRYDQHKRLLRQQEPVESARVRFYKGLILFWALIYKNYLRNINSLPLLAFQFMLPMIQMISFSLCVGGRPTNVGLGIVNHDQPISFNNGVDIAGLAATDALTSSLEANNSSIADELDYLAVDTVFENDSLSLKYLSFIDSDMLHMIPYQNLNEALTDVRKAKLWAVLEIGENFTTSVAKRFDLENFYQLEPSTILQSVIRIYPDKSNKILDMICHRSLVDSYRKFLASEFEQFKRLPIEVARPIFDIKPNVISNSIDGYTESIAPGLLASLTYIMAAGLTTFIMVVERSAGILERTYTSGINPITYLLAHAIFRSVVMMLQIAAVLVLTFYILKQPLVGSIWLAYAMLMVLNMTGISYGLLISSIVADQNGAALTIVSSLVVKLTMSGILWPFEAIPVWLRTICYVQPLTMPVQALRAITLKGAGLGDRSVNLGFLVSITWLIVFLTISTKRFKFYQH